MRFVSDRLDLLGQLGGLRSIKDHFKHDFKICECFPIVCKSIRDQSGSMPDHFWNNLALFCNTFVVLGPPPASFWGLSSSGIQSWQSQYVDLLFSADTADSAKAVSTNKALKGEYVRMDCGRTTDSRRTTDDERTQGGASGPPGPPLGTYNDERRTNDDE